MFICLHSSFELVQNSINTESIKNVRFANYLYYYIFSNIFGAYSFLKKTKTSISLLRFFETWNAFSNDSVGLVLDKIDRKDTSENFLHLECF